MTQSDVNARKRDLIERIQTEGAEAAYTAALEVCRDKKAPAPARATCATTILRAGGYLSAKDDIAPKQPHEMSADELNSRILELRSLRPDPGQDGAHDDVADQSFG